MLVAWSVTEVIRYNLYWIKLAFGSVPYPLLWCRYSFFIVLYPLGVYVSAVAACAVRVACHVSCVMCVCKKKKKKKKSGHVQRNSL